MPGTQAHTRELATPWGQDAMLSDFRLSYHIPPLSQFPLSKQAFCWKMFSTHLEGHHHNEALEAPK